MEITNQTEQNIKNEEFKSEIKIQNKDENPRSRKISAEPKLEEELKSDNTQNPTPLDVSISSINQPTEPIIVFDNLRCLRVRRATYPHQDMEDGSLNGIVTFFYIIPAFSRNPLLMLVR